MHLMVQRRHCKRLLPSDPSLSDLFTVMYHYSTGKHPRHSPAYY
jgi:hypothetical protein